MRTLKSMKFGANRVALSLVVGLLALFAFGGAMVLPAQAQTGSSAASATAIPAAQVVLSEAYLNTITKDVVQTEPDLSNPQVDLLPGDQANVTVTVRLFNFVYVRPTVTMAISVQDHQLHTQIVKTQLSGINAPANVVELRLRFMEDEMNQAINQQLIDNLSQAGLQLQTVQTGDQTLTINMEQNPSIQP